MIALGVADAIVDLVESGSTLAANQLRILDELGRYEAVLVQTLGAALAAGGALLWLAGLDVAVLLPWLAGFLVLTIGGERLELARLAMGPTAGPVLVALAAVLSLAVLLSLLVPAVGHPALGVAVLPVEETTGWTLHERPAAVALAV